MLEAFRKAFKIKDIRKKIGYTFLMLIVIRIGSQLPTPGVNGEYIKNFFAQNTGGFEHGDHTTFSPSIFHFYWILVFQLLLPLADLLLFPRLVFL